MILYGNLHPFLDSDYTWDERVWSRIGWEQSTLEIDNTASSPRHAVEAN